MGKCNRYVCTDATATKSLAAGQYNTHNGILLMPSASITTRLTCSSFLCFDVTFSFSECVALQDPYCAWDKVQGKCRSHGAGRWGEESFFYQSVATGTHSACPPSKIGKDAGSVGGLSDRSTQPKFNQDHQSVKERPDGQVINIVHENKEYENSGKSM